MFTTLFYPLRELADTDFASVQNFVKLGLYLKKWYDKQQASWEVQILKFRNWICLRKLHRSGLDLLPFFQVLPSSAMVFTLIFLNSCSQNLRSFANILPKLDFTKFWRNTKCLCAETLSSSTDLSLKSQDDDHVRQRGALGRRTWETPSHHRHSASYKVDNLTIESTKIFSLGSHGSGVTIAFYHENLLQIHFIISNQTPLQGTCNQHCDGG